MEGGRWACSWVPFSCTQTGPVEGHVALFQSHVLAPMHKKGQGLTRSETPDTRRDREIASGTSEQWHRDGARDVVISYSLDTSVIDSIVLAMSQEGP